MSIPNEIYRLLFSNHHVKSLAEQLNEKVVSPFILSFITAWTLHNHLFVFGIIFFDNNEGCNSRYEFIKYMIDERSWCHLLWIPLVYSFIVLLCFYMFEQLFKAVRVFVLRRFQPVWLDKIGVGDVIETDVVKSIVQSREDSENSLINANDKISKLTSELGDERKERDELYSENLQLASQIENKDSEIKRLTTTPLNVIDIFPSNTPILFEHSFTYLPSDFDKLWSSPQGTPIGRKVFSNQEPVIGKYITVQKTFEETHDYGIPDYQNLSYGIFEIIYRPRGHYSFYIRLKSNGSNDKLYFNLKLTNTRIQRNSDNQEYEYSVPTENEEITNEWTRSLLNIPLTFKNSFSSKEFEKVTGFRIRGEMDVARIRIYNTDRIPVHDKKENAHNDGKINQPNFSFIKVYDKSENWISYELKLSGEPVLIKEITMVKSETKFEITWQPKDNFIQKDDRVTVSFNSQVNSKTWETFNGDFKILFVSESEKYFTQMITLTMGKFKISEVVSL